MDSVLTKIRDAFAEHTQNDMHEKAVKDAEAEIYPTCRVDENGELINEIVVCGMPLFQVSNYDGLWNVKSGDVGEVLKHLREAYIKKVMSQ